MVQIPQRGSEPFSKYAQIAGGAAAQIRIGIVGIIRIDIQLVVIPIPVAVHETSTAIFVASHHLYKRGNRYVYQSPTGFGAKLLFYCIFWTTDMKMDAEDSSISFNRYSDFGRQVCCF